VAGSRSPRPSSARILGDLRLAARKGDRAALTGAVDAMRTLALSPRYWQKYLQLLGNPLARLVDLLVIKQGDRIAHQKAWKLPGEGRRPPPVAARAPAGSRSPGARPKPRPPARRPATQPSLFDA
jgi:hypothetical protein